MDLGLGEVEPEFPPSWDPNPLDLGPGVKEIQIWVREEQNPTGSNIETVIVRPSINEGQNPPREGGAPPPTASRA